MDALALEREQDLGLDRVDPDGLSEQTALLELDPDLPRDVLGPARLGGHRAAQGRDPGPGAAIAQPGVVELVVSGGGAEVPHDRLVALGQQTEPVELVGRPGADVGGRDVPDVPHVKAQQRAQLRLGQEALDPGQPLLAQPIEPDPFLPVDTHQAIAVQAHPHLPSANDCSQHTALALQRITACHAIRSKPVETVGGLDWRPSDVGYSSAIDCIDQDLSDMTGEEGATLGWIGVGRMGRALVIRLLDAGHEVGGLQPHAREGCRPRGAGRDIVDSAADLADRDIVFTMVAGSSDVEEIVTGPHGLLSRAGRRRRG